MALIPFFHQIAKHLSDPTRHVELDVDIGADAKDWSAIQATEKLKPVEADLRRMEEMVSEIVSEMDYLRTREQKLRDTNESTNNRVKWFGFCTTFVLIGLWVWQVLYLRAYFRWVSLFLFFNPYNHELDTNGMALLTDPSISFKCGTISSTTMAWQHVGIVAHDFPEFMNCTVGFWETWLRTML